MSACLVVIDQARHLMALPFVHVHVGVPKQALGWFGVSCEIFVLKYFVT